LTLDLAAQCGPLPWAAIWHSPILESGEVKWSGAAAPNGARHRIPRMRPC